VWWLGVGANGSTVCASAGVASSAKSRPRQNNTDDNMVEKNPVTAMLTR
jgi:hypothetical protein